MSSTDLETIIRQIVREEISRATIATTKLHAQYDGQRPVGVGRTRYLRAWRRGRDAGDPECYADGRARCMTAAAWQRHGASTPTRRATPPAPVAVRDVDLRADVLAELGLQPTKRCG